MALIQDCTVCGIRSYSFKGSDGHDKIMAQLYCTFSDNRTEGTAALSCHMTERDLIKEGVGVGSSVKCFYDKANKKWQFLCAG